MSIKHKTISTPKLLVDNSSNLSLILVSNFNFQSENLYELSVLKGDLLKFIDKKLGGWLLVKSVDKLGNCGLIPASYVDIVVNDIRNRVTLEWLQTDGEMVDPQAEEIMKTSTIKSDSGRKIPPLIDSINPIKSGLQAPVQLQASQSTPKFRQSPKIGGPRASPTQIRTYLQTASVGLTPVRLTPVRLASHGYGQGPHQGQSHPGPVYGQGPAYQSPAYQTPVYGQSPGPGYTRLAQTKMSSFSGVSGPKYTPNTRSNSETPQYNPNPKPLKLRVSTASFMNPYMTTEKPMKDFKAESFSKFRPEAVGLPTTPLSPTPRTPATVNSGTFNSGTFSPKPYTPGAFSNPYSPAKPIAGAASSTPVGPRSPAKDTSDQSPGSIDTSRITTESDKSVMTDPTPVSPDSPTAPTINFKNYDPLENLISVSISNCCLYNNDRYWYRVDLKYPNQKVCIGKFYQNFYRLQASILGNELVPKLPPPIELNGDNIDTIDNILKRCNELNIYINKVMKLKLTEFSDWINVNQNENSMIINDISNNKLNDNEINNKILPNSVNLLYKDLSVKVSFNGIKYNLNLNQNEINSCKVLKLLIKKQINGINQLLINFNNRYESIDSVSIDFIKLQDQIFVMAS